MNLAQPLPFRFDLATLPPEAEAMRAELRAFLAQEIAAIPYEKRARSWSGTPSFSKVRSSSGSTSSRLLGPSFFDLGAE